jgi:hypothetical protein
MPIYKWNMQSNGAIWRYEPDEEMEEIDFVRFSKIKILYIEAPKPERVFQDKDNNYIYSDITDIDPYTLPSISLLFPNLIELNIGGEIMADSFIGNITDIPETVTDITIRNTYITDLAFILRSVPNLMSLTVIQNNHPITFSVPLPYGTVRLFMESVIVNDTIIFPSTIMSVSLRRCHFPRIDGLDRAKNTLYLLIHRCITPYDSEILDPSPDGMYGYDNMNKKIMHITQVNAQKVYLELGSIPNRIKLSENNIDNPIVVALHLQSNYPRRMAEFMAVTEVMTNFILPPQDDNDY